MVVLCSYFQEGLSIGMISLVCFHDLAVEIQVTALLVVIAMVGCLLTFKGFWSFGLDSHQIEFIWTVVPFLIIIVFAVPSLVSLYLLASSPSYFAESSKVSKLSSDSISLAQAFFDFFVDYNPTADHSGVYFSSMKKMASGVVLVTGRQWYWDYGASTADLGFSTSSHMLNTSEIFHLLQLDQWLFLSLREGYTFAITSGDVLHSFAIPTLGIKVDAVPGKDNTVYCAPIIPGLYFGNCSEICGVNHSVMPIGLVVDSAMPNKVNVSQFWSLYENSFNFLKESLIVALKEINL